VGEERKRRFVRKRKSKRMMRDMLYVVKLFGYQRQLNALSEAKALKTLESFKRNLL
jgi:hypothetical protein